MQRRKWARVYHAPNAEHINPLGVRLSVRNQSLLQLISSALRRGVIRTIVMSATLPEKAHIKGMLKDEIRALGEKLPRCMRVHMADIDVQQIQKFVDFY